MFEVSEYRDMFCGYEVLWFMVGIDGVGRALYRGRARGKICCEGEDVISGDEERMTAQHFKIQDIVTQ